MKTFRVSLLFLAAISATLAGCNTAARRSESSVVQAGPATRDQANPIQAYNEYLRTIANGDEAGMRARIYVHPGNDETTRLDRSIAVLGSTARLRESFDGAYGSGSLIKLGFHCHVPGTRLPKGSAFKIEGDHATVSAPGWDTFQMVRSGGCWKEDFIPWPELLKARAESKDSEALPLDRLLPNLSAVNNVLAETAAEVRQGDYLSAADAFGVLNARLHGRAAALAPLPLAYTIDLTSQGLAASASATVPRIELQGDPAELGKSYAAQLGESIRALFREYMGRAFDLSNETGQRKYEGALQMAEKFEPFLRPEHREELHALAAGLGLKPTEVMLGQCFPDLNDAGACSTIALPAAASSDGVARFGRNLDYTTFGLLEQHPVLLFFHPNGRYAFVSVGAPGLIGVLSGMNQHGLTLACMEVPRPFREPDAMPFMLLYRTLLENCTTVSEAIALLQKTPRQSANNLMLMDASGDRAVAEITPSKVTVRRAQASAALVSTNHQRAGDLDSPNHCNRFDFLHDAARRQFGHISESSMEAMLAGAAQGQMTFQSMVFEPANRALYLAVGADAPSQGFARIDLKSLFR